MVLSFVSIEYQDTTFFHKLLIIARRKKRRGGSAHSVDVSCYIDLVVAKWSTTTFGTPWY